MPQDGKISWFIWTKLSRNKTMNARRKQELLKLEAEHLENARFLKRADVVVMTECLFPLIYFSHH